MVVGCFLIQSFMATSIIKLCDGSGETQPFWSTDTRCIKSELCFRLISDVLIDDTL